MKPPSIRKQYEVLHSPFDLETHKATFVNYFETVILPDGKIEYAIPSHDKYVENRMKAVFNITDEDIYSAAMSVYDFWYANVGLILCWSNFYKFATNKPTDAQIKTLAMLIDEGLTTNS